VPSDSPRRLSAQEFRLVEAWGRFGNSGELQRICRDILTRQRQGYPVAFEAWHIIRAHVDHWRLDAPVELDGSRKNRILLKTGPKVVRRLERALRDMIDLHRQSEKRRWYGKKIVAGEMQRRRDGSWVNSRRPWARFPQLYEQALKALDADPLWQTLRETPPDMWLIPPRGNPRNRRNSALMKALRHVGLSKLQVDNVIHALGWTLR
jgi:hypothetical protein